MMTYGIKVQGAGVKDGRGRIGFMPLLQAAETKDGVIFKTFFDWFVQLKKNAINLNFHD